MRRSGLRRRGSSGSSSSRRWASCAVLALQALCGCGGGWLGVNCFCCFHARMGNRTPLGAATCTMVLRTRVQPPPVGLAEALCAPSAPLCTAPCCSCEQSLSGRRRRRESSSTCHRRPAAAAVAMAAVVAAAAVLRNRDRSCLLSWMNHATNESSCWLLCITKHQQQGSQSSDKELVGPLATGEAVK